MTETAIRTGRKPLWKTLYITSHDEFRDLQAVWQNCPEQGTHEMRFFGGLGLVETNAPTVSLVSILRCANVSTRDWITSRNPREPEEEA